jgi:hypothetical protein
MSDFWRLNELDTWFGWVSSHDEKVKVRIRVVSRSLAILIHQENADELVPWLSRPLGLLCNEDCSFWIHVVRWMSVRGFLVDSLVLELNYQLRTRSWSGSTYNSQVMIKIHDLVFFSYSYVDSFWENVFSTDQVLCEEVNLMLWTYLFAEFLDLFNH